MCGLPPPLAACALDCEPVTPARICLDRERVCVAARVACSVQPGASNQRASLILIRNRITATPQNQNSEPDDISDDICR
jgi:hypothetical protein